MKPMGRKKVKLLNSKHKVKENGKNVTAWWENIVFLSKKRDRFAAKKEIMEYT